MTESQSAFLLFVLFVIAQIIVCSLAVWLVLGWQARREIKSIKGPSARRYQEAKNAIEERRIKWPLNF